ncbi:MAG: xanthine dehydrogenase small subunit [Porticoccaceae bacterium]|nr:xanthine dehydrogenase small subunit [Porticoccaceae bacterium]
MVKFLLNQSATVIDQIDPNTTVLDYLREHLYRTGTKEGCASGDCGACTVVIAEAEGDKLTYRSANACITAVGSLHGKQLITAEDLKHNNQLHPVQQTMVDCDGSQCGFCTPGFIMSMFALRKNSQTSDPHKTIESLGGNLCRCTGYRPIVDAAEKMYEVPCEDHFSRSEKKVVEALNTINKEQPEVALSNAGKHFFSPASVADLANLLLEYPQAKLLAGGTDLCLEFTQFLRDAEVLIYTGRVRDMAQVKLTDQYLELGAAVTYSQSKDALVDLYPDLHELIERLGSLQIRNQGTIAGNVGNASPIGDMPPVLIALNAQLLLRKGEQTRLVAVEDYFVKYKVTVLQTSEFIEKIIIPRPEAQQLFRTYKISKRLEDDISATCGAFSLQIDQGKVSDIRIAFGGMAEIPKRAQHCERAILNQPWNKQTIELAASELAKDFTPITDFRASAEYRLSVSQNMLHRLFLELEQPTIQPVRITQYA